MVRSVSSVPIKASDKEPLFICLEVINIEKSIKRRRNPLKEHAIDIKKDTKCVLTEEKSIHLDVHYRVSFSWRHENGL